MKYLKMLHLKNQAKLIPYLGGCIRLQLDIKGEDAEKLV